MNLTAQYHEGKLRRIGIGIRMLIQVFLAIVVTFIGIGGFLMLRSAVISQNVVSDSFDAPASLATRGLSGKVVAAGLLDVLTRIQAANHSSGEHRNLTNAGTSDIEIDIPETAVSFRQVERFLKTRIGHDQRIDGDLVVQANNVLSLTVRGTGILPKTFVTSDDGIDQSLIKAGKYIYGGPNPDFGPRTSRITAVTRKRSNSPSRRTPRRLQENARTSSTIGRMH